MFTHKVNPLYPSSEWPAKACIIVPNNSATVACRGGPRACAFVIERIEKEKEDNSFSSTAGSSSSRLTNSLWGVFGIQSLRGTHRVVVVLSSQQTIKPHKI